MSKSKSILITGGAGFIGSHLVKKLIKDYPNYRIVNLDSLTYASNLKNLENCKSFPNYKFIKGDIRKLEFLKNYLNLIILILLSILQLSHMLITR